MSETRSNPAELHAALKPGATLRRRWRMARNFLIIGFVLICFNAGTTRDRTSLLFYDAIRGSDGKIQIKLTDTRSPPIVVMSVHRERFILVAYGEETKAEVTLAPQVRSSFSAAELHQLATLAAKAGAESVQAFSPGEAPNPDKLDNTSIAIWSKRAWVVSITPYLPAAGAAIAVCSALMMIFYWLRLMRYNRPGYCRDCGYNLEGNESGACPECGAPTKWATKAPAKPSDAPLTSAPASESPADQDHPPSPAP